MKDVAFSNIQYTIEDVGNIWYLINMLPLILAIQIQLIGAVVVKSLLTNWNRLSLDKAESINKPARYVVVIVTPLKE
jgi:hypothetical protein